MSRTYGHKRNWFGGVKKAVKDGCRKFSRAETRDRIAQINNGKDPDEVVFNRYQDCDDHWNYD